MAPIMGAFDAVGLGIAGILLSGAAIYYAIRHARHLGRVQRGIEVGQEQTETLRRETLHAFEIHEVLVRDEILGTSVRRLAEEYSRTLDLADPLLLKLARDDIERARESIRMGAEGHRTVGEDAFSDAETLASTLLDMTNPGDQFWASSLVDSDFWRRADAYVHQQQDKVQEGVAIRRVFVFDTEEAFLDDHAQRQMERQVAANIEVNYVVNPPGDHQDLVVVRQKDRATPDGFREVYAAEFTVDAAKRIDSIDLWSTAGLHSDRVRKTWWALQSIFDGAQRFTGPRPVDIRSVRGPQR